MKLSCQRVKGRVEAFVPFLTSDALLGHQLQILCMGLHFELLSRHLLRLRLVLLLLLLLLLLVLPPLLLLLALRQGLDQTHAPNLLSDLLQARHARALALVGVLGDAAAPRRLHRVLRRTDGWQLMLLKAEALDLLGDALLWLLLLLLQRGPAAAAGVIGFACNCFLLHHGAARIFLAVVRGTEHRRADTDRASLRYPPIAVPMARHLLLGGTGSLSSSPGCLRGSSCSCGRG
mmetsp:Transcript_125589/g.313834  ORF Transcript_125589/g.313834 Transcript_125589/m.313834 type:complete len:233 (+) Transcript_125589:789-1487(+)